uniref:Transmembrane protein n=1 Tax=Cacopsylla melanoneura TaxID=428564 RepID=A0A8D9E639_9HEMI
MQPGLSVFTLRTQKSILIIGLYQLETKKVVSLGKDIVCIPLQRQNWVWAQRGCLEETVFDESFHTTNNSKMKMILLLFGGLQLVNMSTAILFFKFPSQHSLQSELSADDDEQFFI